MKNLQLNLWDLIFPIAKAVDLMSPVVADHHIRVAYLALRICEQLDIPPDERSDIVLAAILHDIGAFSLNDRLRLLEFEEKHPHEHSVAGYFLLKDFEPLTRAASLIRFHHVPWADGLGARSNGHPVERGSNIIHLADRMAVLIAGDRPVLSQAASICETMERCGCARFVPEYVQAVKCFSERDFIWLEATSPMAESVLRKEIGSRMQNIGLDELVDFSRLICRVIDFKSEFTAMHSNGVAASAARLGGLAAFSEYECRMLEVAGYLHDLGKLAIPSEVIEKPGKLLPGEWDVMRTHVFYTYLILEPIAELSTITSWGALHQERMNGTGYPFRRKAEELSLGSRIMAVADIFTALTEDRPYRAGMSREQTMEILRGMVERGEVDGAVVDLLASHFDELNGIRNVAQAEAMRAYEAYRGALADLANL